MNLHAASTRLVPLLCLALLTLAGCSLFGDDRLPFEWVEVGNKLTYDYRAVSDSVVDRQTGEVVTYVEGGLEIRIEDPGYKSDFVFGEYTPVYMRFDLPNPRLGGLSEPGPKRSHRGILASNPRKCTGWPFQGNFYSVRVPSQPRVGGLFHIYNCENHISQSYVVTAVDTTISVPAGTFEVFVLQDQPSLPTLPQRHYWSEQEGLIKMEFLNEDGSIRGAYELASRSWVNTPQP